MNRRTILTGGAAPTARNTTTNFSPGLRHRPNDVPLSVQAGADLSPYYDRPDKPWNARRAGHFLRRTGYGVTREQLSAALLTTPQLLIKAMLADAATPLDPGSWVAQQPFTNPTQQN